MPTFTWTPDRDVERPRKARVTKARFGDGYSQRSVDGINPIDEKLQVRFSNRTRTEINQIDTFLETQGGTTAFDYTLPGGTSKKWVCDEWTPVYGHDFDCSLTATFERVYES